MAQAFLSGPSAVGAEAIRRQDTRQTIRGKEGGLLPRPGRPCCCPTLRIDRALNRLRGTPDAWVSVLA
jgi:hypothetical protein